VESAAASGIPVVIFDSDVDGQSHVSFVATDNLAGGRLAAERMAARLGASRRAVILRFVQGTASTENRAEGFMAAARELGIDVVADPYPEDGTVAGCKKTAANALEGFVRDNRLEVDGIFACNLIAALALESTLDDLRKSGVAVNLCAIGFDSSPKLVEALRSGDLDALVVQNPSRMGYLAVETLVKHLRGEPIEARIDTGVQLVTLERLNAEPEIRALVGP
jgi:ribose transport system substrate-binding protein